MDGILENLSNVLCYYVLDCCEVCCFCGREINKHFYRASDAVRGICHGPMSVCVSATSQCSTKTVKHRMTQTMPRDSPGTVVF